MWRPQKDITIYELACALPFLTRYPLTEQALQTMGSASRHFERIPISPQEMEAMKQRQQALIQAQKGAMQKKVTPAAAPELDGGSAKDN